MNILKFFLITSTLVICQNVSSMTLMAVTADSEAEDSSDVKIQPQITIDDNTVKPALTFYSSNKMFNANWAKWVFQFRANSGLNVSNYEEPEDSAEEIISEFVADGGNIEFDLSFWTKFEYFGFGIGTHYSLLTTDALSTEVNESSLISVDTEVFGFNAKAFYQFKGITGFVSYTSYNTSNEGINADFTKILDSGKATAFGIELPLSALTDSDGEAKNDDYVLRFERTKHSEVDKAIFRVSISRSFDFLGG